MVNAQGCSAEVSESPTSLLDCRRCGRIPDVAVERVEGGNDRSGTRWCGEGTCRARTAKSPDRRSGHANPRGGRLQTRLDICRTRPRSGCTEELGLRFHSRASGQGLALRGGPSLLSWTGGLRSDAGKWPDPGRHGDACVARGDRRGDLPWCAGRGPPDLHRRSRGRCDRRHRSAVQHPAHSVGNCRREGVAGGTAGPRVDSVSAPSRCRGGRSGRKIPWPIRRDPEDADRDEYPVGGYAVRDRDDRL